MFRKLYWTMPFFEAAGEGGSGGGEGTAAGGEGGAGGEGAAAGGEGGTGGEGAAAGGGDFSWMGPDLTPEDKTYLENKHFDGPGKLLKSLRAAESMIRGDQIAGPPESAEAQDEWFQTSGLAKRLGVPAEPTGYGIDMPQWDEGVANLVDYNEERHGRVLAGAHKLNLTPAQTAGVMAMYQQETTADAQAYTERATADETEMTTKLRAEWGDQYDTNVSAALEAAGEFGLDEPGIEALRVGKIAGSTVLTKMLHELALARGNDGLKGGAGPDTGRITPAQAAQELADFNAKNSKALTNKDHPEHDAAFRRMRELQAKAGRGSGVPA
jgi:hypothetical protein